MCCWRCSIALWSSIEYVCSSCGPSEYQYDVCKHSVGSVYIGGYGGLSKSALCIFRELCPVSFLVVGECLSVLLSTHSHDPC